jgi:hypothetical protein
MPPPTRATAAPLLEGAAASAIHAARDRAGLDQAPRFPVAVRRALTAQERAAAEETAKDSTCGLCGGLHPAPNMPACPRVAEFETNADGRVIKGRFWPDGDWDTSRVLFVADAAEETEPDEPEGADGG